MNQNSFAMKPRLLSISSTRDTDYFTTLCSCIPPFFLITARTFLLSQPQSPLKMNWLDLIIVVILIIALVRGFTDGLVKEVAALAALILGIWGAIRFSSFTAGKLYEWFDMSGNFVGIISFLITFGVIVIIIHFIGIIADKIIDTASLGFLNRLLGMLFGMFKTVLILSVFFVILNAIDARRSFLPKTAIEQSKFYNPIADIAPAIFPVIGEGGYDKSFERFRKAPVEEQKSDIQKVPDRRQNPDKKPVEIAI